jgi:hypothetical protein
MWEKVTEGSVDSLIKGHTRIKYISGGENHFGIFSHMGGAMRYQSMYIFGMWERGKGKKSEIGFMPMGTVYFLNDIVDLDKDDNECL